MTEPLKGSLDRANPNTLADMLRLLKIGQTLASDVKQTVRKFNADTAAANPHCLATLDVLTLPDDAKATGIVRAYARATAAAGTLGALAAQAPDATPADAQIAVTPTGDIAVLAASRYTDVDIEFEPARGDSVERTLVVTAHVATIPADLTARGVVYVTEAEATIGGAVGNKIALTPGAGAPAAGQCRLNLAKSTVTFAAADAVTECRVKLLVAAATELKETLDADSTYA